MSGHSTYVPKSAVGKWFESRLPLIGLIHSSFVAFPNQPMMAVARFGASLVVAVVMGWPIQMPTLMTGAIGIGAGIDDAMHVVWLRRRHSLPRAFRLGARACLGSSLVAAVCMLAFTASPFGPTAQFGLLMALLLALAAWADMMVLPACLAMLGVGRAPALPNETAPDLKSGAARG